jgi:glycosyltransferase involved in cell wall biosynthesis
MDCTTTILGMTFSFERTLVVMPALNEEESVATVVAEVLEMLPGVTCLVVDDGSTDLTGAAAMKAGARVATLPFNLGVGGAMRLGFKYALEYGFENVVQIDADGQHDPKNVEALVRGLDSADIVIGARFAGQESYSIRGPRRWAMWILSKSISAVAGTRLTDTTSGFKANGPRAVRLFAGHFPAEYLGDTIEALVIASRAGCLVRQVPVSMRERIAGRPSQNPVKAAAYLSRAVFAFIFAVMRPKVYEKGARL